ncbi:MAG: hypothetical protein P1Q69_07040 [Candidatus Thorarchaeota archaeon]|nr:hypothetical protein [Candidatus Thorarchaeota archaeon]
MIHRTKEEFQALVEKGAEIIVTMMYSHLSRTIEKDVNNVINAISEFIAVVEPLR